MKTILTTLILLTSISTYTQTKNTIFTQSERTIITSLGSGVAIYSFAKPGFKKADVYVCSFGILFAAIPYLFDKIPNYIEVNSSGINFKLKYKKYRCNKYQKNVL